jgi:hypothetical protein
MCVMVRTVSCNFNDIQEVGVSCQKKGECTAMDKSSNCNVHFLVGFRKNCIAVQLLLMMRFFGVGVGGN